MKHPLVCAGAFLILSAMAVADSASSASRGRTLFTQCTGCHNATTNDKKLGPSLKGLFKRSRLQNGKPVNDETVRRQLSNGSKGMPGFAEDLSERDFDDLLVYLKTI